MSNSISSNKINLSENTINKLMKLDKDKNNNITVGEIKERVGINKDASLSEKSLTNLGIIDKKDIEKISKSYIRHKTNPLDIVFSDPRYQIDKNPKNIDLSQIDKFISKISKLANNGLNKDNIYDLKSSVKNMSGFSKAWCKEVIIVISENKSDSKEFVNLLSKKINSETLKKGFLLAEKDPVLNLFKGEKKESFKRFLESYYTDPVLLLGLKQKEGSYFRANNFMSGSIKNLEQSVKLDTGIGIKPNSFGSCQDIQRRISDIMKSEISNPNFSKFFDIENHLQLFGVHNYVLITDKETKQVYQADPWYYQILEGSIKKRDYIH